MRKLFKLVGEITIDGMNVVNKQLTQVDYEARKVQKTIAKLGANMQKAGASMSKAFTLPLLAIGATATKFGSDFEKSMTTSLAIMGNVSEDMKNKMSKAARDVAKNTTVSANEAAKAYFYLASAGLSAAQSLEALPRVAKFAEAGQFEMQQATELLLDSQSALGLKVKNVTENMKNLVRVSDVLVKANTLANASVQQFSEALTNKGAAAIRLLNKDIEEGVAVLSAYAEQGIKGSEAGQQLNIVLRDLQKASINNRNEFEKSGIAVYDASGKMRNIADIIKDLENNFKGLSDEQKRTQLMTLGFTDKSINATIALLGMSDSIKEYEKNLRSAGGITDEVATKQMQNFQDQMKILKNQLIDISLTIYSSLEPVLTKRLIPALNNLKDLLKGIVNWFDNLSPVMKESTFLVLGMVAAFGPMLIVGGKLLVLTKALTSAILLQNAALLANPFGIAAIAITAIGAAVIYTSNAWEDWSKNISKEVENKQVTQMKKDLEKLIPLYGKLALMDREVLGEDNFKRISDQVNELETNLADLGLTFEGGFSNRAVEAENALTDLADSVDVVNDAIDRTPDEVEVAKVTKATIDNSKAQIEWNKKVVEQKLSETQNLDQQLRYRLQLLKMEEDEERKTAEARGISSLQIDDFYFDKREALYKEFADKKADIANQEQEKQNELQAAAHSQQLAAEERYWEEYFQNLEQQQQEELEARENFKQFMMQAASEMLGYISQIYDNYYQSQFNKLNIQQQKEIDNVNKSVKNEETKKKEIDAINKKYAAEELKLKKEQAKKNKAIALFQAVINTALGVSNALQLTPVWLAIAMSVVMGLLGAVQIASIASEPLPMAEGGLVKSGMGGMYAQIGEGQEDEIVLPMKTGVAALADSLMKEIDYRDQSRAGSTNSSSFSTANNSGINTSNEVHLHIGTLVANDEGLLELERALLPLRVGEEMRRGRTR